MVESHESFGLTGDFVREFNIAAADFSRILIFPLTNSTGGKLSVAAPPLLISFVKTTRTPLLSHSSDAETAVESLLGVNSSVPQARSHSRKASFTPWTISRVEPVSNGGTLEVIKLRIFESSFLQWDIKAAVNRAAPECRRSVDPEDLFSSGVRLVRCDLVVLSRRFFLDIRRTVSYRHSLPKIKEGSRRKARHELNGFSPTLKRPDSSP